MRLDEGRGVLSNGHRLSDSEKEVIKTRESIKRYKKTQKQEGVSERRKMKDYLLRSDHLIPAG
jgi:hypothetical protein